MINLKKYIQTLIANPVLGHIKITDDTVYVGPGIYAQLLEKIDESTIDSLIHEIPGKEYAGYLGITNDMDDIYKWDDRYKWDGEEKCYSRRVYTLISEVV